MKINSIMLKDFKIEDINREKLNSIRNISIEIPSVENNIINWSFETELEVLIEKMRYGVFSFLKSYKNFRMVQVSEIKDIDKLDKKLGTLVELDKNDIKDFEKYLYNCDTEDEIVFGMIINGKVMLDEQYGIRKVRIDENSTNFVGSKYSWLGLLDSYTLNNKVLGNLKCEIRLCTSILNCRIRNLDLSIYGIVIARIYRCTIKNLSIKINNRVNGVYIKESNVKELNIDIRDCKLNENEKYCFELTVHETKDSKIDKFNIIISKKQLDKTGFTDINSNKTEIIKGLCSIEPNLSRICNIIIL